MTMFNTLKRCLGIDTLEGDMGFYRKQWTQIIERFLEINDHLVEIKEIIKAHDVLSDKKALNYHLDIMTRLGMILTEVDKVKPKAPDYGVSPMVQTMSLQKECLQDIQDKILQSLQSGRGRYFNSAMLSLTLGIEASVILPVLKALAAQNRVQSKGEDFFRVLPLSRQIQKDILEFLNKHPCKIFHYKELAHHLPWRVGQVGTTLSLMCGQGIIKRVKPGFYGLPTKKGDVHDAQ